MVVERNRGEDVEVIVVDDPEFGGRLNFPNPLRRLQSGGVKKKAPPALASHQTKPTEAPTAGSSKGDRPANDVATTSAVRQSVDQDKVASDDDNETVDMDTTSQTGPSPVAETNQSVVQHGDAPGTEADWVEESEAAEPAAPVAPRRRSVSAKGGSVGPRVLFRRPSGSSTHPLPNSSARRPYQFRVRSRAGSTSDRRQHAQTSSTSSIRFAPDVRSVQERKEHSGKEA
jgi:hypothetical protein